MTSIALTENSILDIVYTLYEGDVTTWDETSDEYLAGRIYCNAAINRWEFYEQTNWRELYSTLTAAADGYKTLTAGDYTYTCPSNMVKPASYVRTVDTNSVSSYWQVVPTDKVASLVSETYQYCYFTGNLKDGFVLHFNPLCTLTTGYTINYEYYKQATQFTTTSSTTELADPYFIVYFVLSRFYESDGEEQKASKAFQESEARLENMRTNNILHLENVQDNIEDTLDNPFGFGV